MEQNNKFIQDTKIIFEIKNYLTTYFLTIYIQLLKNIFILALKIKRF